MAGSRSGRENDRSSPAARASRDMRMTSAVRSISSDLVGLADERRDDLDAVVPDSASVSRMLSEPRPDAQTRPTREPVGSPAISWTSSTYAGPTSIATTGTRPATSTWASSAWNVVVATRS